MSGFLMDLMKPVRNNEDFKGAFRNVKNDHGSVRDLDCVSVKYSMERVAFRET